MMMMRMMEYIVRRERMTENQKRENVVQIEKNR